MACVSGRPLTYWAHPDPSEAPVTAATLSPALPRGFAPAVLLVAGLGWIGGTYGWPGPGTAPAIAVTAAHLALVATALAAIAALGSPRHVRTGRIALTVLAGTVKVVTVFAVVWAIGHPTGFGPHDAMQWVPLGLANAGGGLWTRSVVFAPRGQRL
jgi:hypothetical protein